MKAKFYICNHCGNGDAPHNNHLRERLTFLAQELEKITADLPVWG